MLLNHIATHQCCWCFRLWIINHNDSMRQFMFFEFDAGIIRIIEPLEETRKDFLLVTEEILGSLDGWLNDHVKFQQEVRSVMPMHCGVLAAHCSTNHMYISLHLRYIALLY